MLVRARVCVCAQKEVFKKKWGLVPVQQAVPEDKKKDFVHVSACPSVHACVHAWVPCGACTHAAWVAQISAVPHRTCFLPPLNHVSFRNLLGAR